jgi:crotonobetainyl-CoA:carnitine CoA-transferase CaiB-like acyl-CoA transferase
MNNRGKQSMILNLKQARGVELLKELVMTADVLVESYRPGVMQRLGCDYERLRALQPRLIFCAMSGWGATGEYAQAGGHDLNYAAIAGLVGAMETPQVLGGQIADIGGAYAALAAINAALFRRERTGEGAFLDVSLSDSALPFALYNWTEALYREHQSGQGTLSGGVPYYRVYATLDGQFVALAALEEKFWVNFCQAIERTDLIELHHHADRFPYLQAELTEIFLTRSAQAWGALLLPADCCFSLVADPSTIADHPHYQSRQALGRGANGIPWLRSPIRISGSEPTLDPHSPDYGAHTRPILRSLGYDDEAINQLRDADIVREHLNP